MKLSGFSYIEVILMVALLMVMGMMASPFYGNFLYGQEADIATEELRETLNRARLYSMIGKEGSAWGVAFSNNRVTLFRGNLYSERDPVFDEEYVFHEKVVVSGFDEVTFARLTGVPTVESTITIALSGTSDTADSHIHILTLNAAGVVDETF